MTAEVSVAFALPTLGEEEARATSEAVLSRWVTQGPQVAAFESEFAKFTGAPFACAVSSCTTALHLALIALGVGEGDEVIVPSHSFIATTNVVRYCRATPVFVDVDPGTFNLDPECVRTAFTSKTRAVIAVHQMGMPCDLTALLDLTRARNVPLIEDAACAVGSEIRFDGAWEQIGRPRGAIACFSFHPRKVLTTGDGGMLTTSNPALDAQFRLLRQHGMSVNDLQRSRSARIVFEDYPIVGYNYRLTDVQAAMGRVQLRKLPGFVEHRRKLAARYAELLAEIPGLQAPVVPAFARPNFQSYPVRVDRGFGVARDDLMQRLLDRKIPTRRGVMNAHQEAPYSSAARVELPASESARDDVVLLPMYSDMPIEHVDIVCAALRQLRS